MVPVWKSKDDLQKLVLSLHHVMSGIKLRLNSLAAGNISVGQPWWYYRAERPHVMRTEQGLWFSGSRSPLTLLLRCGEKCLAQPEHQEKTHHESSCQPILGSAQALGCFPSSSSCVRKRHRSGQRPELGTHTRPLVLMPNAQEAQQPVGARQRLEELQQKKAGSRALS